MYKVGIVGTGGTVGIANNHFEAIFKDSRARVCAVFNRHMESAKKWVEEKQISAKVCTSYDELLEEVDAVIICTPVSSHYEYASRAVKANKHVLLEKPMAVGFEETAELLKLNKLNSNVTMVGFVYRYSTLVQAAKKTVEEKIGEVYTVSAWMGGTRLANPNVPFEWRMSKELSGNGALGDFGSHLLDLSWYIAGQRYTEICCISDTFIKTRNDNECNRKVETDDSSVFCTRGPNGIGSFSVSRVGQGGVRIHIAGKGGMLELSFAGQGSLLYWEKDPEGPYTGTCVEIPFEKQKPFQGWFDCEIKDFMDAIEGKSLSYPSFEDGCYVDRVLAAAERASEKRTVEFIDR